MRTIFGPINSRRFGRSLGVDLSPNRKQCNFDCLYCELKAAKVVDSQRDILLVNEILDDIQTALKKYSDIDVLTITANGEPTLYPHLLELIEAINSFKGTLQTLILSNASTIAQSKVQEALKKFDNVKLSLDCATQKCFRKLDRPSKTVSLQAIKEGMLRFQKEYKGNLIIEILIVQGINDNPTELQELNNFLLELQPERIDIGTIDRPPAYEVKAVSYQKLHDLLRYFDPSLPITIAAKAPKGGLLYNYTNDELLQMLDRRPLSQEDVTELLNKASQKRLQELLSNGDIVKIKRANTLFYRRKEI